MIWRTRAGRDIRIAIAGRLREAVKAGRHADPLAVVDEVFSLHDIAGLHVERDFWCMYADLTWFTYQLDKMYERDNQEASWAQGLPAER